MKSIIAWLAVALIARMASAQTSVPQWVDQSLSWKRFPERVFGSQLRNVAPLIQWWDAARARGTNDLPSRPMTAWYRVAGDKVGFLSYAWVVNGWVESVPGQWKYEQFILRDPPTTDEQKFESLRSQLEQRDQQQQQQEQGMSNPAQSGHHHHRVGQAGNAASTSTNGESAVGNPGAATPAGAENAQPDATLRGPAKAIASLNSQLAKMPPGTNYHVDFFAVKLGYLTDGTHREVYDLGSFR